MSAFTVTRISLLAMALSAGGLAHGQAAAPDAKTLPEFDVSTIKPNNTGSGNTSVNTNTDTLRATNVQLIFLLEWAFNVKESQIFGLPHWAEASHYDIVAKVVDATPDVLKNLTREERAVMVRHLLEDRLQMKTHTEVRTLPVLELVPAKDGSKLVAASAETANLKSSRNSMHQNDAVMTLTATHDRMEDLAGVVADQVHKPVVDKTGLTGVYDFELKWQRDDQTAQGDGTLPTLYTALQEQLGLKLESGKAPVNVVVIDQITEPTEN